MCSNVFSGPSGDEKKASKDHDGDGKVESGSKEHAGAVHKIGRASCRERV